MALTTPTTYTKGIRLDSNHRCLGCEAGIDSPSSSKYGLVGSGSNIRTNSRKDVHNTPIVPP